MTSDVLPLLLPIPLTKYLRTSHSITSHSHFHLCNQTALGLHFPSTIPPLPFFYHWSPSNQAPHRRSPTTPNALLSTPPQCANIIGIPQMNFMLTGKEQLKLLIQSPNSWMAIALQISAIVTCRQ